MNKLALLALPVLAVLAIGGLASAFPVLDTDDMTQEEKGLRVQMLEMRQEALQDQIAYLNGDITQEQLRERMQAHMEDTEPLREQMREMLGDGEGCACGGRGGTGPGFKSHERGMMGGL